MSIKLTQQLKEFLRIFSYECSRSGRHRKSPRLLQCNAWTPWTWSHPSLINHTAALSAAWSRPIPCNRKMIILRLQGIGLLHAADYAAVWLIRDDQRNHHNHANIAWHSVLAARVSTRNFQDCADDI